MIGISRVFHSGLHLKPWEDRLEHVQQLPEQIVTRLLRLLVAGHSESLCWRCQKHQRGIRVIVIVAIGIGTHGLLLC